MTAVRVSPGSADERPPIWPPSQGSMSSVRAHPRAAGPGERGAWPRWSVRAHAGNAPSGPPSSALRRALRSPRPVRAPRPVIVCWALGLAIGASAIGDVAAGSSAARHGGGLSLATLPHYLVSAAGAGARDLRINGVYGSGHDGSWQFVAHLSWRTADGQLTSAAVDLPQQLGAPGAATADTDLTGSRLTDEQRIGWTAPELERALDTTGGVDDAPVALVELQTSDAGSTLTACRSLSAPDSSGESVGAPLAATCSDQGGDRFRRYADALHDVPDGGALSVQRDGHLLTP